MVGHLVEGFETRQHATYFSRLYPGGLSSSPGTSTGRRVGSALAATNFGIKTAALVPAVENTWIVCFAIRIDDNVISVPGGTTAGVRLHDGVGEQIALVVQPGATHNTWNIELRRGATVLATTPDYNSGSQRSWQYFQWKVTVRTGTNGLSELRRWGYNDTVHTVVHNLNTINTANQGTDGADIFEAIAYAGGNIQVALDDIVLMDDTGGINDDFTTDPLLVVGMLPDGDGNSTDWAPSTGSAHWSLVDDPATLPADTEYVSSSTVAEIDQFGFADMDEVDDGSTGIAMVQVVTTAAMLASGSQTLAVSVRSGGTDTQGSDFTVDSIPLASYREVFDQNPVGPAAWTKATVEAAQIGAEVRP